MKPILPPSLTALAVFALSLLPAVAAEPNADQLLRQMSAKLAAGPTLSFEATRTIDPSLIPGGNLPEKADLKVAVIRPNKFKLESSSDSGVRDFYANGRNLSEVDVTKNLYATVPMRTSVDRLAAEIQEKYGFTLPLVELANSNVYRDIQRQAEGVSYLGRTNYSSGLLGFNNTQCDR